MLCFFSDKPSTIHGYRSELILLLEKKGYTIKFATLSNPLSLFFFFSAHFVILSNIRSVLFGLLFFFKRKLVIINGLGRYRRLKIFRHTLYLLFLTNRKSIIIFQNYADYRFYRLKVKNNRVFWIPGSGGKLFTTIDNNPTSPDKVALVTRKNKIKLQANHIEKFQKSFPDFEVISYGLSSSEEIPENLTFQCRGIVERERLVQECRYHYSPTGYGEGVPHTLVDAICNDLTIIVSKRDFIRYGFYIFNVKYKLIDDFCLFEPKTSLKIELSHNTINQKTFDTLLSLIST